MHHSLLLFLALLLGAIVPRPQDGQVTIDDGGATIEFPDRLTFSAGVRASAPLDQVVLEYGVDQRTCGEVIAKAFPTFEAGNAADVSWTWEMRQSGSLPPGATIWYRWRATDANGAEHVSEERRVTWIDDFHPWHDKSQGKLTLHWYEGSDAFAADLLGSAAASLERLGSTTGVTPESQIHLYIYANSEDMQDAVLYEPGWTGGLAYAEHNLTIIGIAPQQLSWGKRTAAHELTHVLVGNRAFSCLGGIPTWLSEGIAVYGEGGPEPYSLADLRAAIEADTILSVRSLSGNFSEDPRQADLSYVQSWSLVNYLIETYGPEKLLATFDGLRDGTPIEDVMQAVYGFGLDGLEDQWRASVGARPRPRAGAAPTARPVPSPVPTFQPVGAPPRSQAASRDEATPEPAGQAPIAEAGAPAAAAVAPAETPGRPSLPAPLLAAILLVGIALALGSGYAILYFGTRQKKP